MSKTITKVGPADHDRRMSLGEFEHAEVEQGFEKSVRPPAGYRTRLLPGLVFSCSAVFKAAGLA